MMTFFLGLSLAFSPIELPTKPPADLKAQIKPPALPIPPAETETQDKMVNTALADAETLSPSERKYTRYFDARIAARKLHGFEAVTYHVNLLSRASTRFPLRKVTNTVWAINIKQYRYPTEIWELLATVDPYYHTTITPALLNVETGEVTPVEQPKATSQGRPQNQPNQGRPQYQGNTAQPTPTPATPTTSEPKPNTTTPSVVNAPWIGAAAYIKLMELTESKCPIVRADWFMYQTSSQIDRGGVGYYDWFGFKKREDVEKFIRLDKQGTIELEIEMAGIFGNSQVAWNNRQVFRQIATSGGFWFTKDVINNTGKRNARDKLLDDFKHDAEEIVFTLPNKLPGYYLSDANGKQQDVVPPTIAFDDQAPGKDKNIYVCSSCVRCHTESGLKTMRNYIKQTFKKTDTNLKLGTLTLNEEQSRRIIATYLNPLEEEFDKDVKVFESATKELTGLTGAEISVAYMLIVDGYIYDDLTLEMTAFEAGVTPTELKDKLTKDGPVDLILQDYILKEPRSIRRKHIEERWVLIMTNLLGLTK